jgi:hypothetical protein
MNNINTVLNKIKKENDKNINTKERLIRKKTNNIVSQQKLTESITSKINSEKIKQLSISFPFKFLFNRQTSVKLVKPFFSNENNKQNIYNILYTETINDFCNFYKKEDKKNENKEKQILERKERLDDKEWENYVSIFSDEDLMNIKYIIKSIYNKINIFYKNYPFYKENINMKLVNVYQQYFAFNKKVSGWGDFIRGSYFLMQFCEEDKIDFDMDLSNHIISKFLKKYSNNKIFYLNYIEVKKKNIYKTIIKFEETNFMPKITKQGIILPESKNIQEVYNSFASYLNRQSFFCDYCKTFSNNFVEDIDISNKADINIDSHIKKIIQYEYAKTTSNTNTKYVHTVSFPFYGINNTHRERMKKEIEPS